MLQITIICCKCAANAAASQFYHIYPCLTLKSSKLGTPYKLSSNFKLKKCFSECAAFLPSMLQICCNMQQIKKVRAKHCFSLHSSSQNDHKCKFSCCYKNFFTKLACMLQFAEKCCKCAANAA